MKTANHWCDLPLFTFDPPDTRKTTLILAPPLVTTLVPRMLSPQLGGWICPYKWQMRVGQGVVRPPCEFPSSCPWRDETGGPHCLGEKIWDASCGDIDEWVSERGGGDPVWQQMALKNPLLDKSRWERKTWEVGNDRQLDDARPMQCMWLEVWRREKKKRRTWGEQGEAALSAPARLPRSLQ